MFYINSGGFTLKRTVAILPAKKRRLVIVFFLFIVISLKRVNAAYKIELFLSIFFRDTSKDTIFVNQTNLNIHRHEADNIPHRHPELRESSQGWLSLY